MSAQQDHNPKPSQKTGRCIVWSPPGVPQDPHLSHALHRPNLDVRNVHDDLGVIAATLEGLSTRDLTKHEPRILLCIEPHRLTGLAECLEVLTTYVHELTLWVFDPSRFDVLRKVSQQELLAYRVDASHQPEPTKPEPTPIAEPARKPKIDIHQAEAQRTMGVTPSPTLNIAPGQTAWAGPWGPETSDQKIAETAAKNDAPTADSVRTESWNPTHKLRLAGSDDEAPAAPAAKQIANVEPAPLVAQPPAIPVAPVPPTPVPSSLLPAEPPSQEPLLTDEELAMLLGDDPRFSGQS